jgi:hypothetical protein
MFFLQIQCTSSAYLQALKKREAQRDQGQYTTPHGFLQNIGIPFIYSLINEIQDAFHYSGVLSAFGFLDPRNLPSDVEYLQCVICKCFIFTRPMM